MWRSTSNLAVVLGVMVGSCGGGAGSRGGGPVEAAEIDARVTAVRTDAPQLGHEIEFETEIQSLEREENVTVSYYMVSEAESAGLDVGEPPQRQQLIGSVVFPVVEAGIHVYSATLVMPEDIDDDTADFEGLDEDSSSGDGGDYQVFATVDPGDMFREADETDNAPEAGEVQVIRIGDDHRTQPDFVLQALELDTHTLFLRDHDAAVQDGPDVDQIRDEEDQHLGATVELIARGALAQTVDLSFWIVIPNSSNTGLAPTAECWPLQIWDSELQDTEDGDDEGHPTLGEYTHTYEVELSPDRTLAVHLDLLIPTADDLVPSPDPLEEPEVDTYQALVDALENSDPYFEVRAYVNWDRDPEYEDPDAADPDHDDNVVCDTVYVLPPDDDPVEGTDYWQAEQAYQKGWANDLFGAGVDFEAVARLDGYGASARLSAGMPMKLFGSTFNLLRLEGQAQFVPQDREESSFQIDLEFAELLLYTHSASLDYQWEWSQHVAFDKSREMSSVMWVAIVPVLVRGEIGGNLGFDVLAMLGNELEYDTGSEQLVLDGLVLDGTPFVDSWAHAQATIDLLLASGEVRGELTFLQDRFHAAAWAGVFYHPDADPVPMISGGLDTQVTNQLQGPKGRLYVDVSYPGLQWCKGLFGIPYPCGATSEHASGNLAEWDAWHKDDVLLDFHEVLASTPALFD